MSRQPYVYTMPESFLKDKSVPARWRVLGVINGFIINGGCFYGSNEWLMEQLGCTEPTISAAFAELEALNLVEIRRTARSRKVYRKANDPNQLGSETQTEPVHDPSQLGPNSVSNSEKNTGALEDELRVVVKEESEEESRSRFRPAKYPHALEVFTWFPKPQASWKAQKSVMEREYAEYLYARTEEAVRGILAFCVKYGDMEFFPAWQSPSKLEKNWVAIQAFADRNGL